ncbi:MAG: hypothetical protein MJ090_04875 [Clostridia bacterium]|nr:hypothetical protein [Clostridia bacterium]
MFKHTNSKKIFEKRCGYAFFMFICFSLFSVLRISVITSGKEYALMQTNQSYHRIKVAKARGTVYDTNMIPLTNNKREIYVAIPPTPEAIMDVPNFLSGEEKERVLQTLRENNVAVAKPKGKVNCEQIVSSEVYSTDADNFVAEHIIGYTDFSGHGICGIEKAYDNELFIEDGVEVLYETDAKGKLLYGNKPKFNNDLSKIFSGVRLTVDLNIQEIAQKAARNLKEGAVVISDAKSGKIRAAVSKPAFSLSNISGSLSEKNSPLLNRITTAFSVGSIFKLCVAAAATEKGNKNFQFNCKGKTRIIDRDFSCHKKRGHGYVGLSDAIAFSCNTFFYNLGIKTGADSIYNKATVLSFGNKIKLADNYYADAGNLTRLENLKNSAQIANFSIGQGDLMLSPVSMLNLYMSIANEGYYITPSIVEATVSQGRQTPYNTAKKTKVMEKQDAEYLKKCLKAVVDKGTGIEAKSKNVTVAGKTATAQTGRYKKDKTEITNSWFCGFFPYENPKYIAIVMSDGNTDCSVAKIFSEIAENICKTT